MDFDRSLIFAYLEEDNVQRAYFRVRPLLTVDGDIQEEALKLWPNEGGLRIVPDRNEQHTFKIRMRTLGSYCVVDLRNQPPEAGKIRTNKNFRLDKSEVNQYILYSDTVHELPENTFFQLMEGQASDYTALAEKAVTPLFYIRQNDTIYGPIRNAAPAAPEAAAEAAFMLYEISCPDGVKRMFLCISESVSKQPEHVNADESDNAARQQEAPDIAPVEGHQPTIDHSPEVAAMDLHQPAESLPIGETLHILTPSVTHDETIKQLNQPVSQTANLLKQSPMPEKAAQFVNNAPLSGTPLIKTPLHLSVQQSKNRTQEVVSNQWSVGKYEPPAQNLPSGAAMRSVENPVEAARKQLRTAWNSTDARNQLIDFILSLEGAKAQLEAALCEGSDNTVMQRVLRDKLQDLEAERLTALCELDKARRDLDAYKQELMTGLSARIAKDTKQLQQDKTAAEEILASLKKEMSALTLQRDALLDKINELQNTAIPEAAAQLLADVQMTAPINGVPLRITPVPGETFTPESLIARLMHACAESGIEISRNHAIALLVLLAVCPRIGLTCPTPAASATLLRNIAGVLGWKNSYAHQYSQDQRPLIGIRPLDATPAVLATSLPNYAPIPNAKKLLINRSALSLIRNAAYDVSQWPVLMLPALPFVPEIDAIDEAPVSAVAIEAFAKDAVVPQSELEAVFAPVINAALPLSGSAKKEMFRFASVCAGLMEGGLPVAVDWAILLWIVPSLERGSKNFAAVKASVDEYPLSRSKL